MNESLHSLFLAQALGLYLLIVAIVMLSRAGYYRNMLANIKIGSPAIVIGAIVGLIVSIPLVLLHNIWVWESEVLITLVAWFLLIKSVLWLSLPEFMIKLTRRMYSGWGYYVAIAFVGIIAILLITHGFYLFHTDHII
ncbi:MAG: hypothetical protein H0U70_04345 [Tatlockia sp.]|nr:hypothetical protein [Tatlockia sp.]